MRRAVSFFFLVVLALALVPAALAKFGISKTRLTLPRTRPPEIPILAANVFLSVRVEESDPASYREDANTVRDQVAESLRRTELYQLVDRAGQGTASVTVSMSAPMVEVRDEIRTETRSVVVGTSQEWDDKKKKYVTKDVYEDQSFDVTWRIAEGNLTAHVSVEDGGSPRSSDVSSKYSNSFNTDYATVPDEADDAQALSKFLVAKTAARAAAVVSYSPDPVEALLAVNGELKDGNKLAEAGHIEDALGRWSAKTYKGATEAARLHNVGVAHEAMAYTHAPDSNSQERELEEAKAFYGKASTLDPGEKYYKDPLQRIEASLGYADTARQFTEDRDRFRNPGGPPAKTRKSSSRAGGRVERVPGPAPTPRPSSGGKPAASLRNGSFDSSYDYWTLAGKGNVADDPARGRVFEASARAVETSLEQELGVPVTAGASLSLDYRVVSGHPAVRADLDYLDAGGEEHSASLDVAKRAAPADWSHWSGELSGLTPTPAKVTGLRIVMVGGTVRIDNVALAAR